MKYPYISSYPLIVEAFSDVRKLVKTLSYTEQDAYTWAIEAARQIGGNNYDKDTAYLAINRHSCGIPRNFYLVNSVWLCSLNPSVVHAETPVRPSPLKPEYWIKTSIMRPADTATLRMCNRGCINPEVNTAAQNYTIKVPPGVMRTSFPSGTVCLEYLAIPMDAEGIVLVQDEVNTGLCIKAYIKRMLLQERWLMGELRRDVWESINDEFEDYLRLAQQQQKGPDPSKTALKAAEQDARYRRFDHRIQ